MGGNGEGGVKGDDDPTISCIIITIFYNINILTCFKWQGYCLNIIDVKIDPVKCVWLD